MTTRDKSKRWSIQRTKIEGTRQHDNKWMTSYQVSDENEKQAIYIDSKPKGIDDIGPMFEVHKKYMGQNRIDEATAVKLG